MCWCQRSNSMKGRPLQRNQTQNETRASNGQGLARADRPSRLQQVKPKQQTDKTKNTTTEKAATKMEALTERHSGRDRHSGLDARNDSHASEPRPRHKTNKTQNKKTNKTKPPHLNHRSHIRQPAMPSLISDVRKSMESNKTGIGNT